MLWSICLFTWCCIAFAYKSITLCWFQILFQVLISDIQLAGLYGTTDKVNKGMRGPNGVGVGGSPLNVSTTGTVYCLWSPYLLGDFEPCLLESEDWAAVERRRDLQQCVVVVQAAADVSHRHPLLNHGHAHVDIVPMQDLCRNPVADLKKKQKNIII